MNDALKPYCTTGEAADMLGISTSTVIRKFDRGELAGKRHPLTGKRLVERRSVDRYLQSRGVAPAELGGDKRRVLIADANLADAEGLHTCLNQDSGIAVEIVSEGCEVCGKAMEWGPHVALVSLDLPDMRGRDVVRSLARLPLPEPLRILVASPPDMEVPPRLLAELGAEGHLPKPWRLEAVRARIRTLLGLKPDGRQEAKAPERRRWQRQPADWPASLEVRLEGQREAVDSGRARIRDISDGGAFLDRLDLASGALPAKPFFFALKVAEGKAKGFQARGRPVRLETKGDFGLGVSFEEVPPGDLERLHKAFA